jgi:hypothetical protein
MLIRLIENTVAKKKKLGKEEISFDTKCSTMQSQHQKSNKEFLWLEIELALRRALQLKAKDKNEERVLDVDLVAHYSNDEKIKSQKMWQNTRMNKACWERVQ